MMDTKANNSQKPSTFSRILRRMFLGELLFNDQKETNHTLRGEYDSPSKQAVKRFFRKPTAVVAFFMLIFMMLFVLIAPIFFPIDLSYTEISHKNIAPTMSLMNIPADLKTNPISISSKGTFSLGVDQNGKIHIWGYYQSFDENKNVLNIPNDVKNATLIAASAGTDHCVAIGNDGTVYTWGEYDNAQYGDKGRILGLFPQPAELMYGGALAPNHVKQLLCGDQMTAILMDDGVVYVWGNAMGKCTNLEAFLKEVQTAKENGVKLTKVAFTNVAIFGITDDGRFLRGNNQQYDLYKGNELNTYIGSRKITDIAATGDSIVLVLDDGELITTGNVKGISALDENDKIKSIEAGSRHFVAVTESGKVLAWGSNALGQTTLPECVSHDGAVDSIYASGFQNYAFKDGKLVEKWGLKGYLMGTDDLGRDIFTRVINGGKMTMTIGAVSVIVSSIIGIIIGCLSGYFGGIVDILLMRFTEIVSAIPFLPFALVLSAILQGSDLNEDTRIFIIMVILGILSWTGLAKLVRAQILSEREKEFVLAAKAMGIKEGRIAFRHILLNIVSVVIVSLTLDFASCMLTESSLSYLGFGVKPPRPTWGNMLYGCKDSLVIQSFSWRWIFPALFLAITVICINIIGDTIRDILDPKSEVGK